MRCLVGVDGLRLLTALWQERDLTLAARVARGRILWLVWLQNYTWAENGQLRWRTAQEVPPAAQAIRTPYDPDARFSQKRSTAWVGYKVHLTETCDPDLPRLITNVETTLATTQDSQMTTPIHQALADKDCLPAVHIVDCGYMSARRSRHQSTRLSRSICWDLCVRIPVGRRVKSRDFHSMIS